ncbi:MAG: hypothetical protein RI601_11305 [Desulfurivibrionaceae bacterium]|nr:hypothetical protein [Desulfurivibrionaceae bacterium]
MTDQKKTPSLAWQGEMLKVVAEIIEETAFSEVRGLALAPVYHPKARGVSLLIHKPVQGEFLLCMEQELLTHLSTLVYGPTFAEITSGLEGDFLAELLNIIAGRFLAAILPPEQGFSLGLPVGAQGPMTCPAPPCLSWHFSVDEMPFTLLLHGESILTLAP